MIKNVLYLITLTIIFVSCGSQKTLTNKVDNTNTSKDFISIIDKIDKTYIQDSTITFNSRLEYIQNGKSQPKVSMQTKMHKNEFIWASASMIVPLGRVLITPDGAKGYAKFPKKVYFDSDYSFIEDKIQLKNLEYEQIESLLTGRPLFDINPKEYSFSKSENGYIITYKDNEKLIKNKSSKDVTRLFQLNKDFLITKQSFIKPDTNSKIEVYYNDFTLIGTQYFPKLMKIIVVDKKNIELNMTHKTINVNELLQVPFKLPTNYQKLSF